MTKCNLEEFYQVGEIRLPDGYEGRELHFYVSDGRVEIWILPEHPNPGDIQTWLAERRKAGMCV